jgi:hypothetical protein
MKIIFILFTLFIPLLSFTQVDSSGIFQAANINDGPYIFNKNDTFTVKWIENDILKEVSIDQSNQVAIRQLNLLCEFDDLAKPWNEKSDFDQSYRGVKKIVALSDLHGRYNAYINLLKANHVIDDNLNWKFGKGHLVVLGDIFDRGDKVTEILWHLFSLEKQAKKAGGMVHVLLGNHEMMVLNKDLRYINEKYKQTEALTKTPYDELFSVNSVLGKWLRSKPVTITINDIIFVHAGISTSLAQSNITLKQINQSFSDSIIGKDVQLIHKSRKLELLYGDIGPLWSRSYFNDTTFQEDNLDAILNFYDRKHIVVGHTPFKEFKRLFGNKIIGIDNGIMYDQPGGLLMIRKNRFYKGLVTGERIKM